MCIAQYRISCCSLINNLANLYRKARIQVKTTDDLSVGCSMSRSQRGSLCPHCSLLSRNVLGECAYPLSCGDETQNVTDDNKVRLVGLDINNRLNWGVHIESRIQSFF